MRISNSDSLVIASVIIGVGAIIAVGVGGVGAIVVAMIINRQPRDPPVAAPQYP